MLLLPLEDCLARNASRKGRVIPEDAIRGQRADMDRSAARNDTAGFPGACTYPPAAR